MKPIPGLAALADPAAALPALTEALQQLSDHLVCNVARKEAFCQADALPLLKHLFGRAGEARAGGGEWSGADELTFRTLVLHRLLCRAGFHTIHKLVDEPLMAHIVAALDPAANKPKLVYEALRTAAVTLQPLRYGQRSPLNTTATVSTIKQSLFGNSGIARLRAVLSQRTASRTVFEQKRLALLLLRHCDEPEYRYRALRLGLFDELASHLAAYVHDSGCPLPPDARVPPRSEWPVVHKSQLTPLLGALSRMIGRSSYLFLRLTNNRLIRVIFPVDAQALPLVQLGQPTEPEHEKLRWSNEKDQHTIDALLPTTFCMSKALTRKLRLPSQVPRVWGSPRLISPTDEFKFPIISWLFFIINETAELEKLAAVELLTQILIIIQQCPQLRKLLPPCQKNRQHLLGSVIPQLTSMIDHKLSTLKDKTADANEKRDAERILEQAPYLIYRLSQSGMKPSYISSIAAECSLDKVILRLISYNTSQLSSAASEQRSIKRSTISADGDVEMSDAASSDQPTPFLYDIPDRDLHRLQVRAATFYLASTLDPGPLPASMDLYKQIIPKIIVDVYTAINGYGKLTAVPEPIPPKESIFGFETMAFRPVEPADEYDDPDFVKIAACVLLRVASRTYANGNAFIEPEMPVDKLIALATTGSPEVQAAATDVCCNMALPISPVHSKFLAESSHLRQILKNGLVGTGQVQLSSIWVLKNLASNCDWTQRAGILKAFTIMGDWFVSILSWKWPILSPLVSCYEDKLPKTEDVPCHEPTLAGIKMLADPEFNERMGDAILAFEMKIEALRLIQNLIGEPRADPNPELSSFLKQLESADFFDSLAHILRDGMVMPWISERDPRAQATEEEGRAEDGLTDYHPALIGGLHPTMAKTFPEAELPNSVELLDAAVSCLGHIAASGARYQKLLLEAVLPSSVESVDEILSLRPSYFTSSPPTPTITPAPSSPPEGKAEPAGVQARPELTVGSFKPVLRHPSTAVMDEGREEQEEQDGPDLVTAPATPYTATDDMVPPSTRRRFLSLITPLFAHPDLQLRHKCVWLYHNLLWEPGTGTFTGSEARAAELRELGWEGALRMVKSCEARLGHEKISRIERRAKRRLSEAGKAGGV